MNAAQTVRVLHSTLLPDAFARTVTALFHEVAPSDGSQAQIVAELRAIDTNVAAELAAKLDPPRPAAAAHPGFPSITLRAFNLFDGAVVDVDGNRRVVISLERDADTEEVRILHRDLSVALPAGEAAGTWAPEAMAPRAWAVMHYCDPIAVLGSVVNPEDDDDDDDGVDVPEPTSARVA